jgi:hypothetical protein
MKTLISFSSVIIILLALVQISYKNGYSASGVYNIYPNDSTFSDAGDSLVIPGDSLLAKQEKLAGGKVLYEKKCQKCHELYSPNEYKLNEWKENLDEMKEKAELTKGEYKLILAYLSANCKK